MRVLHINTFDRGGAANAALRLHDRLIKKNIDSRFLLLNKTSSEQIRNCSVQAATRKKKKPGKFSNKIYSMISGYDVKKDFETREQIQAKIKSRDIEWFSFPDTGIDITRHPEYKKADIVNFHWVADFPDYSFFKKNIKPFVWTLHDMAPFTGGCHYSEGCRLFLSECDFCPLLNGTYDPAITNRSLIYKQKNLSNISGLTIVAPSEWILNQSKDSRLFKNAMHYHIPNGIDSTKFKKHDKMHSRQILGLPEDKIILLFIAFYHQNIKRKGFSFLNDAFSLLKDDSLILCSVGNVEAKHQEKKNFYDLGLINDENKMSLIYSAADAFVIPSIEDNLPNTVLESLMCGTPVIGFSVGGIKDMIKDSENGYLVADINSKALAEKINLFLKKRDTFDTAAIRNDAIERFDINVQANSYIELYQKIVNQV